MRKAFRLCAVAAAFAGAAGIASASTTFTFNPTGGGFGGGAVVATDMDQAQGNALAIQGVNQAAACAIAGGWTPGDVGVFNCSAANIYTRFLYQANLGQMKYLGSPVFNQNDGGRNFTYIASVLEQITTVAVLGVNTDAASPFFGLPTSVNANFVLAAGNNTQSPLATDFFRMFYTGATGGNDLTGANFSPAGAPNPILEGRAYYSTSTSTSTTGCAQTLNTAGAPAPSCSNLDNFDGDSWNSFDTVDNNGSTTLKFLVTAANASYFPDLPIGTFIELDVNTSQVVPFNQANPSCALIDPTTGTSQGYALGTIQGDGTCQAYASAGAGHGWLGGINGFGLGGPQDFLFQADANTSLQFQRVPEPGTLALLAGSLMGIGLAGRRRRTKK